MSLTWLQIGKGIQNGAIAFWAVFCMFLTGGSVGWLVGLSSSPVIQGIITALTGILVTVAGLYSGATTLPANIKTSPTLLAFLLFGIATGACGGLYCRTHNTFGADAKWIKGQLTDAGVPESEANKYVAASTIGCLPENTREIVKKQQLGQLYSGEIASECTRLRGKEGDELVSLMRASSSLPVSKFATRCKDSPEFLKAFVEEILCAP